MTVLIVGGAYQGKTAFARTHFPERTLVQNLHLLVRAELAAGGDPANLLPGLLGKVIICDEIGCGVIPIDPAEERWREETGRLCCTLAANADAVYRIWSGIPHQIK